MSGVVAVRGYQGFVISTDSIVFKYASDNAGALIGKVKGITRKLFQIHDDILVATLGNWNSYFPLSGMLGIAALVSAYNAFALSLCNEISGPFDTVLFMRDGIFNFSGGVTRLPVGEFI